MRDCAESPGEVVAEPTSQEQAEVHMFLPVSQSALPPDAVHIWRTAVARERRLHISGRQDFPGQLATEAGMVAESVGSY